MQLTTISCNSCGAPLQIPASARFVTCKHCSAQLAVKHNDSVTFTELLGEIGQQTQQITADVAELKYRQQLEDIDRQWEQERESYMVTGKHGHRHLPSTSGSVIGGIMVVVFGVFFVAAAGRAGPIPVLFGLVFIGFGLVACITSYAKADAYQQAEQAYHRRRSEARKRQYEGKD